MPNATTLRRNTPEAEGISSSAVLDFIHAVEQHAHPLDALHGFMLLRHGSVVAEGWWQPFQAEFPHTQYSLSKSFTAAAIGLAVADGMLTVNDPVLQFFPDDAPAHPGANLRAMRVRHLLSMNTGHKEDTTQHVFRHRRRQNAIELNARPADGAGGNASPDDDNWPRAFLSLPVEYEPGTWFVYNTAATYMLSAIITRLTGQSLLDYLRPRLFDPLGIENPTWETDPRAVNLGGTGLHIKTEDIARFGQMYLQRGMWNGQRILAEEWIAEATQAASDNSNTQTNPDWMVGYGYQFWRSRHNCYRGDGAFGQFCLVMPEQDAVLAIVSGVRDMQAVLDKVWAHLLPAMQAQSLPANPQACEALRDRLAGLSLPLPDGKFSSPRAAAVHGKFYALANNDLQLRSVSIEFAEEADTLTLHDERGHHRVRIGHGRWLNGTANLREVGDEPVAASGAWTDDDTCEVWICIQESEVCPVLRFRFEAGKFEALHLEVEPNVSWGDTAVVTIVGHLVNKSEEQ